MKFLVINDHVCMIATAREVIDDRSVWVPVATRVKEVKDGYSVWVKKLVTLCGDHELPEHDISLLSDEVPPFYLCSKCDAVSNRKRVKKRN